MQIMCFPPGPSRSPSGTPSRTAAALSDSPSPQHLQHLRLSLSPGPPVALPSTTHLFMSSDRSCHQIRKPWRARTVCCWLLWHTQHAFRLWDLTIRLPTASLTVCHGGRQQWPPQSEDLSVWLWWAWHDFRGTAKVNSIIGFASMK